MIGHWRKFGPKGVAAVALALALSACNFIDVQIGDQDGVPLAELDIGGDAPDKLVLAGPDTVVVTEGDELEISVSGDAGPRDALRFTLEDGTLGITRDNEWDGEGTAVVNVTMPPARELVLAGSGDIRAAALVDEAEVNIAGSGMIAVAKVAASRLNVNVMGSGTLTAAGEAERLDLNVAGSGAIKAPNLKVERAEINIAGSGGGEFASDGKVEARIAGSGDVVVYGRADCSIRAMGSGQVRCRPADSAKAAAPAAPAAPARPTAPKAPPAPKPE